jgi:hypothetical protein
MCKRLDFGKAALCDDHVRYYTWKQTVQVRGDLSLTNSTVSANRAGEGGFGDPLLALAGMAADFQWRFSLLSNVTISLNQTGRAFCMVMAAAFITRLAAR